MTRNYKIITSKICRHVVVKSIEVVYLHEGWVSVILEKTTTILLLLCCAKWILMVLA